MPLFLFHEVPLLLHHYSHFIRLHHQTLLLLLQDLSWFLCRSAEQRPFGGHTISLHIIASFIMLGYYDRTIITSD